MPQRCTQSVEISHHREAGSERTMRRTTAKVFADHVHMQVQGYGGMIGAMIFVTACHFTDACALRSMSATESTNALKEFTRNCGIPETMVTDGHNSLLGEKWKQLCRDRDMKQLTTEPHSHWQNLAEAGIRELKRLYVSWSSRQRLQYNNQ